MTMITLLTNSLYLQDYVSMFVFILCLYGSSMCKICVLFFFSFECSIGINCGTNLKGAFRYFIRWEKHFSGRC